VHLVESVLADFLSRHVSRDLPGSPVPEGHQKDPIRRFGQPDVGVVVLPVPDLVWDVLGFDKREALDLDVGFDIGHRRERICDVFRPVLDEFPDDRELPYVDENWHCHLVPYREG
jgi:hypothetical protein